MRIGFLSGEYFGYKNSARGIVPTRAHGGFGYVTRKKCEELVKRGHEIHVFVPAGNYAKDPTTPKKLRAKRSSLASVQESRLL